MGGEFRISERGQKFELGPKKEDDVINTFRTSMYVLVGVSRRRDFTPVRVQKIKRTITPIAGQDAGKRSLACCS